MKNYINLKNINFILGISLACLLFTIISMELELGHWARELHEFFGMVTICLIILHIIFNFKWIKSTYFKSNKT